MRWTRNDPGSGLANGETAVVKSVEKDSVRFGLEDGPVARLAGEDPQLRHLDRGWASTIHAFQGRTVDGIIAAMPTGNPDLTNQRAFYVAISRARDDAELATDDAWKLSDQLEKATGERVSALDGAAKEAAHETVFGVEMPGGRDRDPAEMEQAALDPDKPDRGIDSGDGHEVEREHDRQQQEALEPIKTPREMDLEL